MDIPKETVIGLIRERAEQQIARVTAELPDHIDPEQHRDLLAELDIDPEQLVGDEIGDTADTLGLDGSSSALA
jgi:hypothetical protein